MSDGSLRAASDAPDRTAPVLRKRISGAVTCLSTLSPWGCSRRRPPPPGAAKVYDEIQSAKAAQDAADAEARRVLREQRRAEYKDKWEQFKNKVESPVA